MSDQLLAFGLTLAFFALLAAWVPLLDFLRRRRARKSGQIELAQRFALTHRRSPPSV